MRGPDERVPEIPREYADVRFACESGGAWPKRFAIITAYATTGETWTAEKNAAADASLRQELERRAVQMRRVSGFSPGTGHAEPGWAVAISLDEARELGRRYQQHAIFWIDGDELAVCLCDDPGAVIPMGSFRARCVPLDSAP